MPFFMFIIKFPECLKMLEYFLPHQHDLNLKVDSMSVDSMSVDSMSSLMSVVVRMKVKFCIYK